MRGNKFEKSYIHILESETLSRDSRVTESAQKIVDSIPYISEHYTYVYHMSTLLFYCWEDVLQESEKIVEMCLTCEELVGVAHRR